MDDPKLKIELKRAKHGSWTLRVNDEVYIVYNEVEPATRAEICVVLIAGVVRATSDFLEKALAKLKDREKKK